MGKTPIQWSEFSINPIRARGPWKARSGHHCVKVSPGCKNCYASRFQPRVGLPQFQEQRGEQTPELFLDPRMLAQVLRRKKPTKFFWCDMTDMFGDWVPFEWIAACFGVMAATPRHTHQVLTKRAQRMREFFAWLAKDDEVGGGINRCVTDMFGVPGLNEWMLRNDDRNEARDQPGEWDHLVEDPPDWPLQNVHLGVSAEDQQRADERWAELRRCPAIVRWISAEPLLGPIAGQGLIAPRAIVDGYRKVQENFPSLGPTPSHLGAPGIDWIVVGGESGRNARPFDVQWARDIIAQGRDADVPVFVKQLGANPIHLGAWPNPKDGHGGDIEEWPDDLRVREFPR